MHPSQLQIKDFTYHLPDERIARYPLAERDLSKLLVYKNGIIKEDIYRNIGEYTDADTLLLFNNTRVIEARMLFTKSTGSTIEIFCLEPSGNQEITTAMFCTGKVRWNCLIGGASKWKQGLLEKKIRIADKEISVFAENVEKMTNHFIVEFSWSSQHNFAEILHYAGILPLPPYLQRQTEKSDYERYQTVYSKHEGSVAAPTAGLHFTNNLLSHLHKKGIAEEYVTLHVGAGTFKPVKSEIMQQHEMHKEWIQVKRSSVQNILNYAGKTIIPVGTTSLRTLETLYWMGVKAILQPKAATINQLEVQQWDAYDLPLRNISAKDALEALLKWMDSRNEDELVCHTQILIAPGYKTRIADALITNFHQPGSTLLLLVAALTGNDWTKIYGYALQNGFRFLSYGDGSLLWTQKAGANG